MNSELLNLEIFKPIYLFAYLLLCLFAYLYFAPVILAEGTNLVTVSPQLVQLDLSSDPSEAQYSYTNDTDQTIELALTIQDVKELEDRGIPGLLDPNESKSYKYGLSSWATFSNNDLVIAPGETKTVTVYIDKDRLTIGGHYASVLAEIRQIDTKKTVKLRAILASHLFVRTGTGNEREEAKIVGFDALSEWLQFPSGFQFRLHNLGNVDVTPYGLITIFDSFGHKVTQSAVNEDSLITLPDSIRKYTVPISSKHQNLIPGIYKAHIAIHYGKKNLKQKKEVTFFTLGSLNGAGIGAIILIIITFIVMIKLKKKQFE